MRGELMYGYIHEQPEAVTKTLHAVEARLGDLADLVAARHPKRMVVAGFGSSYTAAQIAAPVLRRHVPIATSVVVATDIVADRGVVLDPETVAVFVSRSGERGWLVDSVEAAREGGALCVAVTGSESSLLAQRSQFVIGTAEGPEGAYSKTKSVITTAAALMQLGLALDADRGAEWQARRDALSAIPQVIEASVAVADEALNANKDWLARHQSTLVTGSGGNYGVAHEGALKIQEAAGWVAQYENTGDAIHGALGVLGPDWLVVSLVGAGDYRLGAAFLDLVREFGADRLCIAKTGLPEMPRAEQVIELPSVADSLVAPLAYLPTLQLLTYHMAVARDLDPDHPVYAETMLRAMLPKGRTEPDWRA